ncbi:MAG TPA: hypothetical protein VK970_03245 [Candidatus Methylacidiphilales bacterium]|nr:hypothetical protein [Candidatus Methylacidiphilales bacterium]
MPTLSRSLTTRRVLRHAIPVYCTGIMLMGAVLPSCSIWADPEPVKQAGQQVDTKTQYCDRYVQVLEKPSMVQVPNPAYRQPTSRGPAMNRDAVSPYIMETAQRFKLKSSSSDKKDAKELEAALVKLVGKPLEYDQFNMVEIAHVDTSKGERIVSLYAMHLKGASVEDVKAALRPTGGMPGDVRARRLDSFSRYKLIDDVLLVLAVPVENLTRPFGGSGAATPGGLPGRGTTKSDDLDKKLASLEKGDKPAKTTLGEPRNGAPRSTNDQMMVEYQVFRDLRLAESAFTQLFSGVATAQSQAVAPGQDEPVAPVSAETMCQHFTAYALKPRTKTSADAAVTPGEELIPHFEVKASSKGGDKAPAGVDSILELLLGSSLNYTKVTFAQVNHIDKASDEHLATFCVYQLSPEGLKQVTDYLAAGSRQINPGISNGIQTSGEMKVKGDFLVVLIYTRPRDASMTAQETSRTPVRVTGTRNLSGKDTGSSVIEKHIASLEGRSAAPPTSGSGTQPAGSARTQAYERYNRITSDFAIFGAVLNSNILSKGTYR